MVEPRHPALPPIPRGSRWLMGLVSALLFLVPLVNLVMYHRNIGLEMGKKNTTEQYRNLIIEQVHVYLY